MILHVHRFAKKDLRAYQKIPIARYSSFLLSSFHPFSSPTTASMRKMVLLLLALITLLAYSATCSPIMCPGGLPYAGIWTDPPVLVNQTTNGLLYTVGGVENPLQVLHLYGTPYQMGQAHGILLKDNILLMYQQFYAYVQEQADGSVYPPLFFLSFSLHFSFFFLLHPK
jgi:hypothetical protein